MEYELVLIDATESPIERPKKAKKVLFRKKEKTYVKNSADCGQEKQIRHLYNFHQWQTS